MAILYVFTVNDTQNSGPFPPEIVNSDWFTNITNYANFFSLGGTVSYSWSFVFDSESDLNDWLTNFSLTDVSLLSSIEKWKVDHRVEYSHKFYSLPELNLKGVF